MKRVLALVLCMLLAFSTLTAAAFAETRRAGLTVMKDGDHWFHPQEQMRFLDEWIKEKEAAAGRE